MKPHTRQELLNTVFQWDVSNWSKAVEFWAPSLPKNGSALTLGERDGGLSLWLASNGLTVICTDLDGPTDKAKSTHTSWDVNELITYESADMTSLPYPDATFDVVAFKSVIGGLSSKQKQVKAMREIHRVLKPGGVLLMAENLVGTKFHRFLRRKFTNWAQYWRYLHAKQDLDLFGPFTQVKSKSIGVSALFGRTENSRKRLAKVDRIISPVVPKSWRYIWFVVAKR